MITECGPSPPLQAPFPVDSQASCLGGTTSPPLPSSDLWENLHWLVIDSTLPAPLPQAPVKLAASWGRQSTEGVRGREQRPSDPPPLQLTLIRKLASDSKAQHLTANYLCQADVHFTWKGYLSERDCVPPPPRFFLFVLVANSGELFLVA